MSTDSKGHHNMDGGQEHGNYYSILGPYRDNGKENGSYYLKFRVEGSGLRAKDLYDQTFCFAVGNCLGVVKGAVVSGRHFFLTPFSNCEQSECVLHAGAGQVGFRV